MRIENNNGLANNGLANNGLADNAEERLKTIYKATLDPTSGKIEAGHGYMGVYTDAEGQFHTVKWMTHFRERGFSNHWNMKRMKAAQGDAAFLASKALETELLDLARTLAPDSVRRVTAILRNYTGRSRNQYDGRSLLSRAVVYSAVRAIRNNIEITAAEKAALENPVNTRVNAMDADTASRLVVSNLDVLGRIHQYFENPNPMFPQDASIRAFVQRTEQTNEFQQGILSAARTVIGRLAQLNRNRQSMGPLMEADVQIAYDALSDLPYFANRLSDNERDRLAVALVSVLREDEREEQDVPRVEQNVQREVQNVQREDGNLAPPPTDDEYQAAVDTLERRYVELEDIKDEVPLLSAFGNRYGYDAFMQCARETDFTDLPQIVSISMTWQDEEVARNIATVIAHEAAKVPRTTVYKIPGALINGSQQEGWWYLTLKDLRRMVRDGLLSTYGAAAVALYVMQEEGENVSEYDKGILSLWAKRHESKTPLQVRESFDSRKKRGFVLPVKGEFRMTDFIRNLYGGDDLDKKDNTLLNYACYKEIVPGAQEESIEGDLRGKQRRSLGRLCHGMLEKPIG